MTSLPTTCLLPLGLDLIARRLVPTSQHAARVLHWSYSSVSGPFSLADPHDDPSLRALYEPYPSGTPNKNIFELEDSSYDRVLASKTRASHKHHALRRQATVSPTQLPHTARSNALLVACVKQGDYATAISLRRDLDALHTPITRNAIYAEVAHHLLDNPDQSNPRAFLEWCKLVPNSDPWTKPAEIPPSMITILTRLLQNPEDIDTLCRFSTLAARKGMAKQVAIPAISHVARYSTPETASKLLLDIIKAAAQSVIHSRPSTIPSKVVRSWNSTFIRALCLSGRVDAARQSLLALHSGERTVSPSAYRIVAEELEALGRTDDANHLRALCGEAGFSRLQFPFQTPILHKTAPMPLGTVLQQLRWIRRRIDAGLGVSTSDLASFMKSYLSTGHHRALPLLRNRMIRHSDNRRWKHGLGLWGTAEMQLYRSAGKHEEVFRVFQSIFLPVGVTNQLMDELGVPRPSPSFSPQSPPSLWPPSEALALASWSAAFLASSRGNRGLLERCYSIFLNACSPTPGGLFQLPPAMKPDAATFQPWVGAFARASGPEGIIQVIGDMRQLGIPPSVMTWNALAKAYVTKNEWDVARSILMKMEASRDQKAADMAVPAKMRLRNRLGPLADWGFPAANLSTYYTLLRELWMTKQISAARELVDLLMRSGYKSGDQRLDSFIAVVKGSQKVSIPLDSADT
ncbi:hypothetical protein FRC08_002471 [Ceratobasidium sp. 394]|nr:hypothetical protein FRC08_002471 [Ceratobasidium sp. 394]